MRNNYVDDYSWPTLQQRNRISITSAFKCHSLLSDFKYFLIERMMDWNKALEYCRINYMDLANIRSETDKSDLAYLVDGQRVWIGLHNRWRWSDGSIFTLHTDALPGIISMRDQFKCVFLNVSQSLVFNNCSLQQPFYCHKGEWTTIRYSPFIPAMKIF